MMAEASISVDLFNPGQVFACLGFLEAADVLCGDAEGGFDWTDQADVRFLVRADGKDNPFAVVLDFLAEADFRRCAPEGYTEPSSRQAVPPIVCCDGFPERIAVESKLPARLERHGEGLTISHFADGSSRSDFKLYSGNQKGWQITRNMLERPGEEESGLHALWRTRKQQLTDAPLDILASIPASFGFDARGSWNALDAGFSPDKQRKNKTLTGVRASPVVELLAAMGLEHARPDEYETRQVRYGAWGDIISPMLARPALAGVGIGVPIRTFRFELALSGKNKVVTFAQEETRP